MGQSFNHVHMCNGPMLECVFSVHYAAHYTAHYVAHFTGHCYMLLRIPCSTVKCRGAPHSVSPHHCFNPILSSYLKVPRPTANTSPAHSFPIQLIYYAVRVQVLECLATTLTDGVNYSWEMKTPIPQIVTHAHKKISNILITKKETKKTQDKVIFTPQWHWLTVGCQMLCEILLAVG